ncbi:MAG: helix-turn-helix domain-containing protein [Burkholderiaceae bacterium]|nr:helix-turn-helix domain-containing protein [Burkholderiaceae bacterium]
MNEGQRVNPAEQDAHSLPFVKAEAGTAGALLRAAREAQGLHIAALAVMLKVPQSKLQLLEADRYDELPDATFVRALAKTVCRALKLDAEPILALLPAANVSRLEGVNRGLNQPFRNRVLMAPGVSPELLRRPAVLGVALILLAALAVYLMPVERWTSQLEAFNAASAPSATPAASAAREAASSAASGAESGLVLVADQAGDVQGRPPGAAASAVLSAAVSPAPETSTMPAATPVSEPASAAPIRAASRIEGAADALAKLSPVRVRANETTWIELVDAHGQVLLSKLMHPGDVAELQALAPIKLRVGNVSGTELSLRGEIVDLSARAQNNVARIELQ